MSNDWPVCCGDRPKDGGPWGGVGEQEGGSPFESSVASAGNQRTSVAACAEVASQTAARLRSTAQEHTQGHTQGGERRKGGLSDRSDSATGKIGEQGGL